LLAGGADVHAFDEALGRTALHYAFERACSPCVDVLLAAGGCCFPTHKLRVRL
jgi:hypothetical protein